MRVIVSTEIVALHCWPDATVGRNYLTHPHMHKFRFTVWAGVTHVDREIEFHDLRDELDAVILKRASYIRTTGQSTAYDFGGQSCEMLGQHILNHMPQVQSVRVMEDEDCGAEVQRSDMASRPKIITICGSTKFKDECMSAAKLLELAGYAVFMVGSFMHKDNIKFSDERKKMLDSLHRQKIEMSDAIYVLNVDGYIGESTTSEIELARKLGKEVVFLEPDKA